jgi:hypothetical protein
MPGRLCGKSIRSLTSLPLPLIKAIYGEIPCRPPYQQNDYIGWITRAKREETRQKRLTQMLEELQSGAAYMGMAYNAKGSKPTSDIDD